MTREFRCSHGFMRSQVPCTDARATPAAVAALDQMQRSKPLVPPHLHIFVAGKCKRCGKAEG